MPRTPILVPNDLVDKLELIIAGKDDRLVGDLRAGVPDAFVAIGNHIVEAGVDLELAERCFDFVIRSGNIAANINLGRALARQPGREEDAEKTYLRAIEAGVTNAYNNLGILYQRMHGRRSEAEACYRKGFEAGDPRAAFNLANLIAEQPGREEDALELCKTAIDRGMVELYNKAGMILWHMLNRPEEAEIYFRKGAEHGAHEAMNNLGWLLLTRGSESYQEIEELFRRAIAGGNVHALNNLANLLSTQEDRAVEACAYYLLAIEAGHPTAGKNHGKLISALAARGEDLSRITAESIQQARRMRGRVARNARLPTADLLDAFRLFADEQGTEAMRRALGLLAPALLSYQSGNLERSEFEDSRRGYFDNVASLVQFLSAEHVRRQYAYRGQVTRRDKFVKTDRSGNTFVYENMFPHDFRFVTKYPSWDDPRFEEELQSVRHAAQKNCFDFILHVASRCHRDRIQGGQQFTWLHSHYGHELEAIAALPKLPDAGAPHLILFGEEFVGAMLWRLLWALAQHYELSTALLDVTFSPEIAGWFATNEWNENSKPPREGRGVIYRFDIKALTGLLMIHDAIETLHAAHKRLVKRISPFVQDLREIPASFAARPLAQQGGSIYGLDSIWLLESALASNVIDIFEFKHGNRSFNSTVTRERIIPRDDPFLAIAQEFQLRRVR